MTRRPDRPLIIPRFRRSKPDAAGRAPATAAFGVGLGVLLLCGLLALIFHVSALRSGNHDLRGIADAAEDRSRDQARRFILGQPNRQSPTAVEPQATAPAAPSVSPSYLAKLWNRWFASKPGATQPDEAKSATAPTSTSELLERMRAHQPKAQLPPNIGASANTAPTPEPAVAAAAQAMRASPEQPAPLSRVSYSIAEAKPVETRPADIEPLLLKPHDTTSLARFLLSEHDVSLAVQSDLANAPAAKTAPALIPEPAEPPSQTSPPTPLVKRPPAPVVATDTKRRHASAAECTAVIEQAQLGELTDRDRLFLQEHCR